MTVIRCSVGGPSECRDASASLTCAVPISRVRELGSTFCLQHYSKLDLLAAVVLRLGLGLEFAFSRNRYRKSWMLKNVMFALDTESPSRAPTRA